ncbi:MAG TPA: hypothetical protein VEG26_06450 [Steroidobacteraceae bacterium]|nr:hypothetical protein [Steroidobacteraceae bacterium]
MSDSATPPSMTAEAPRVDESLVTYTNVIYALHSLSVLIGFTTWHTVILSFVGGLPSIVAVIMNYARRSATRGTYLESHFRWQIRTFWYAVLWVCAIIFAVITIIGIPFAFLGALALAVWIIYRIARGWLALRDKRAMYV